MASALREKQKLADGGGTRASPSKQPIMELGKCVSNPDFLAKIDRLRKGVERQISGEAPDSSYILPDALCPKKRFMHSQLR
jgi:hypothetical protein